MVVWKRDMAEVAAQEALRHMESLAMRVPAGVDPGSVVEAGAFHHQRVTVPMSDRISQPGWIGDLSEEGDRP